MFLEGFTIVSQDFVKINFFLLLHIFIFYSVGTHLFNKVSIYRERSNNTNNNFNVYSRGVSDVSDVIVTRWGSVTS